MNIIVFFFIFSITIKFYLIIKEFTDILIKSLIIKYIL